MNGLWVEEYMIYDTVAIQDFKRCKVVLLRAVKSVIEESDTLKWIERHHVKDNIELIFKHSLNIVII